MGRKQPPTLALQKQAKRKKTESTAGKKGGSQKFNTGVNLEALYGSLAQLFESFSGQTLDNVSVDTTLLMRAIYRNLTPKIAKLLSNPSNVKLLSEQLSQEAENRDDLVNEDELDILTSMLEFLTELREAVQKLEDVLQEGEETGSGIYPSEMEALSRVLANQYDEGNKKRENFLKDLSSPEKSLAPPVIELTKALDDLPSDFSFNNVKVFVASPKLTQTLLEKLKISEKALQSVIGSTGGTSAGAASTSSTTASASSAPASSKAAAAPAQKQQEKKPALMKAAQDKVKTLNEKVGTNPSAGGGKSKNVTISLEQFNKLMDLAKQQEKTVAGAQDSDKPDKEKPSGLGALAQRAKMSDAEAFQRNINEGYAELQKALGDKNMEKIGLPSRQIAAAIRTYFGATTHIVEDADSNLNSIENDLLKGPQKGLIARIKGWIFKTVIGGILALAAVRWIKNNIMSWMPKGKDGNILHGPSMFGIKLPNLTDIVNIGRAGFTMLLTLAQKIVRFVKGEIKGILKAFNINNITKFLTFLKNFALGYISGKILAKADKCLAWLESIPAIGGIAHTIKMSIRLISMLAGAIAAAVNDWLGSGRDDSGLSAEAAKWGEDKLNELIGENMHGAKAGQILASKASKIKPLVPVASVLPESMKAKDASGKVKIKALIPNLPVVKLATGTVEDEESDINKVAKQRREKQMESAGKTGASQIDKGMAGQPEPPWDVKYGDPSPEKRATLKFLMYARKNKEVLEAARKKVVGKFDGPPMFTSWNPFSDTKKWLLDNGKNPKISFDPQWQYTGKNAEMLKSVMPIEPYGDSTKGQKYEIAKPWEHEVMGVLPLGVRIPSTNAAWVVDAKMWEADRLDIGIAAWHSVITFVEDALENNDTEMMIGSPKFMERLQDGGMWHTGANDWVRISTRPNYTSRIADRRKSTMVDEWNSWYEKFSGNKAKVKEIKEGIQADRAKDQPGGQLPAPSQPAKPKGPSFVSRFWTAAKGAAGKLAGKAKDAFNKGGLIGLAKFAGRGFLSLFSKQEQKKATPPPPPKPPSHGTDYITNILGTPFWKSLSKDGVTAEELRKTLAVDKWFDQNAPAGDKVYQTEVGKMFYNILLKLGFKYDRVVWQNPQFMQVRPKVMPQLVDSLNDYLSSIVQPHGAYLMALLGWAKAHGTKEEQDAVLAAAQKEVGELSQNINRNKFWEFVAANYIPTDMHLVVRDKDGKIIREEGKELRGLMIPKELFDQDPAYWGNVMEMLNQSAVPPQDLAELQTSRALVFKLIKTTAKGLTRMRRQLQIEQLWTKFARNIASLLLHRRMRMFTRGVAEIRARVLFAKKEILMYSKYRRWVETGSWWALDSFVYWGDWLNRWARWNIFGSKLNHPENLGQKMLGSVREIIRDRRGLIKKMRTIISKILEQGITIKQKEEQGHLSIVKSVFTKVVGTYKNFVVGQFKRGMKIAGLIRKATRLNLGLFNLFGKKKADEKSLEIQTEEMAKEMVPEGDTEGKERLKNIMQLAQERKKESANDQRSWKSYWREMRRKWQDRISVESMNELKGASLRLSDNIFDYIGLVKEIPVGNNIVMDSSAQKPAPVYQLMPDVAF